MLGGCQKFQVVFVDIISLSSSSFFFAGLFTTSYTQPHLKMSDSEQKSFTLQTRLVRRAFSQPEPDQALLAKVSSRIIQGQRDWKMGLKGGWKEC